MDYIKKEPIIDFIIKGLNNPDKTKAFGYDAIEILTEIRYSPTADVVPMKEMDEQRAYTINMLGESLEKAKSDVEELSGKYEDLKLKYAELQKDKDELIAWGNDEKTEVAREIISDIADLTKQRRNEDYFDTYYQIGYETAMNEVLKGLLKLKKKYTEGRNGQPRE